MGAAPFRNWSTGKTPEDAFGSIVNEMQREVGRGGYSGTIAEKHSFALLTPPPGVAGLDFVRWVMKSGSEISKEVPPQYAPAVLKALEIADDKYGPAAAVEIKGEELEALKKSGKQRYPIPEGHRVFFFFGWAPE